MLPSRRLTYPTLGKGKSSSKCHFWWDMLVPRRVRVLTCWWSTCFSYPSFYRFISKVYCQIKVPVLFLTHPCQTKKQKKTYINSFLTFWRTCGDHHQRGGHEAKYISTKSSRAQLAKSLPTLWRICQEKRKNGHTYMLIIAWVLMLHFLLVICSVKTGKSR